MIRPCCAWLTICEDKEATLFVMVTRAPPPSYEAITDGVIVRVRPKFMHDESKPATGEYVWAYTVEIENGSDSTWQIMRRHWRIVDAEGRQQLVEGEGVVGQQPVLNPGEAFRYTSGAPLAAPSGVMTGAYDLETDDGASLTVEIPVFSLDSPYDQALPS